jgi:hypothetical protein
MTGKKGESPYMHTAFHFLISNRTAPASGGVAFSSRAMASAPLSSAAISSSGEGERGQAAASQSQEGRGVVAAS